ncbi:C40 family peptidase [Secundilactobacillus kimchicus]|uniref:C40 family peptidase n=1 Tax=Secundilactobacillus kimchicus TaxID=528209 RepID=UPI0024A8CB18|nr:NlpC/P60 family protein [Secundilactobacillus kimchicus]
MKKFFTKVLLAFVAIISFSVVSFHETDAHAASFTSVYQTAKNYLGTPYVYGATGPTSFDCSGFTSYVYKKAAKVTLPRTAQAQYNKYDHVSAKTVEKGDLVFFGASKLSISHVGMYIGNGKMIDAQNRGVVIEKINAPWWNAVGYAHVTDLD